MVTRTTPSLKTALYFYQTYRPLYRYHQFPLLKLKRQPPNRGTDVPCGTSRRSHQIYHRITVVPITRTSPASETPVRYALFTTYVVRAPHFHFPSFHEFIPIYSSQVQRPSHTRSYCRFSGSHILLKGLPVPARPSSTVSFHVSFFI